jgi:hypothetical protein
VVAEQEGSWLAIADCYLQVVPSIGSAVPSDLALGNLFSEQGRDLLGASVAGIFIEGRGLGLYQSAKRLEHRPGLWLHGPN